MLSRKPRPLAVVTDRPGRSDPERVGPGQADAGEPAGSLPERALAHVDELFGLARHLCATPSDAEDLVQETYARALGGVSRLAPGANLRAWLFRILRNCFIDQARRKKVVLEISDDTVGERAANEVWDVAALDQLRYLAAADLERAVATLPLELRFIVVLDAQGFNEAEIADIARCAPGTVKSRLSRARARLRVALQGTRP
jgi:RNA polymerase sigma-70 factor (ECF subfamily)